MMEMKKIRMDREDPPHHYHGYYGYEANYETQTYDGDNIRILDILRKKRHLLDDCFEDEYFNIEPC